MNPSLSMTLKNALTITRIAYIYDPSITHKRIIFRFEGKAHPAFQERIAKYLETLQSHMPFLANTHLEIDSENSFPHSSGIASSASALGALAMCLVNMEEKITGNRDENTFKKGSFLARLGSGSACRSIFPHFALWGATGGWSGSTDEYAIPVSGTDSTFMGVRDSILIVESNQKQVSSSAGHKLMETNPYAASRFQQAHHNLERMKGILAGGDWKGFIEVMEEEALSLHAMMMTSKPGYILMKPGTLEIIRKVRDFRSAGHYHIGFTLDAGANVHLLYEAVHEKKVKEFITSQLLTHCENNQVIHDQMGTGPTKIIP
jgi:diphosphomevalonate decarboxylase